MYFYVNGEMVVLFGGFLSKENMHGAAPIIYNASLAMVLAA